VVSSAQGISSSATSHTLGPTEPVTSEARVVVSTLSVAQQPFRVDAYGRSG
jgi:hypothetical protein